MPVKVNQGDLLSAIEDIVGHQVNCQGVMGSGVAKALRETYPSLYPSYKKYCEGKSPEELLGNCQIVGTGSKFVANIFGQLNYGRQKIRYTDYDALKNGLFELKNAAKKQGYTIALPYNIGCGLANGDWNIVERMIQEVFADYEVTLYRI